MSILSLFRPTTEVQITEDDLDIRPMTSLDHFISKTHDIVDGLDDRIVSLDFEINRMIAELADLRRIKAAQEMALRMMKGDI